MTAALVLGAALPLFNPSFKPVTIAQQMQLTPNLILGVLELTLAIAYVALWRAAPDFRVFRTLGLFFTILGTELVLEYAGADAIGWTLRAVSVTVIVEAAGEAMRVPNRWWTKLFWPFYFLEFLGAWLPSAISWRQFGAVSEIPLAILIYQGFRHGNRRDRMIAAAFTLDFIVRITIFSDVQRLTGIGNYVSIGGWHWRLTGLTVTTMGMVTLAIFIRALIYDRSERQRLATELEAARAIQQLLIPERIPSIRGFNIQSVYKPYGEVGGDFFQILPVEGGSTLVAIGDVSGKGLPAAMQVSLLAGTLRALADSTQSPAAMLTAANRHMIGRSNGGFTTCLILRADPDRQLTFASAGHIPPYLNGKELPIENGLPLGLVPDVKYAETTLQFAPGDTLILLTDGVVEARNATGELFGFDRTRAISTQPAQSIARAASTFGQEDDITVLTLTFAPAAVAHART